MVWNSARVNRLALAIALAFLVALPLAYVGDKNGDSLLKRGDYPGFFVISVLQRHQPNAIYDAFLQRDVENEVWPSFNGGFYMSVYPPYTALLLRPLAWFTPQVGQILFTLFHLLALAASLHILAKINPSLSAVKNALIPLSLCFAPLFCGVIGAQNTALSMLLYSLVLFGLFKGDSKGEWLAGLSLGTWLFKPQLGVFAIALAFFLRRPRIIFAASLVTVFYYLLGWLATNATWPLLWIRVSSDFAEQNLWANAPQMVSFVGSLKIFVKALGFEASSSAVAAAGVLGGAALIGVILFYSLRHWQSRSTDSLHTLNAALLLGPTLVITAPQVLFYDLGIALVSLFAVLDFKNDRAFNLFLSLCAVTLPLTYFRDLLPISPFLLIALFILLTVKKEAS